MKKIIIISPVFFSIVASAVVFCNSSNTVFTNNEGIRKPGTVQMTPLI
jgi:hypothetical protein